MALLPLSGRDVCAALPRAVMRQRTAPLWAITGWRAVGSPTMAASAVSPRATAWAAGRGPRQDQRLARGGAESLPRGPANTLLIFVEPDAPPKTGPLAAAL